jgi:hypothetical protein
MTKDEALDLALELRELADKFSEGWHDGIKIDASHIMLLSMAASQIEQARSAPVQEPAEVLGHNGWGFPIKAAAPVQKKCDCAAHSAADCVCGAWDKSAVAPVREDWGPGPHECHSLTASVQEPVAWRYRGILHEFDPSDWAEGPVTPLYTTPPAQRQWVGLTENEIEQEFGFIDELLRDCVQRTESKLKEKNT